MKQVVVIGGGFAGIRFLENLCKRSDVAITLIDQNPYHSLQPEVYGYVANSLQFSDILIDLHTLCASFGPNVSFHQAEVSGIDTDARRVIAGDQSIDYDYLVIAPGSRTFFPPSVKGLGDVFTGGIKSIPNALVFKQHFERNMIKMIESEGSCQLGQNFDIVIGGAGLSGVETAAEMAWYAKNLYRHFGYLCEGVQVTLACSGDRILPGTDDVITDYATKRLEKLGVNIRYNTRIGEVAPDSVTYCNGHKQHMDFLVWTGGIVGSPLIRELDLPKNSKHFLQTDDFYRIPELPEIFAIGDAVELKNPLTGTPKPPTSQMAERTGEYVARIICQTIDGYTPKKEALGMQGLFVALGGNCGVGVIQKRFHLKGLSAHLFKQGIFKAYKWPLQMRCRRGYRRLTR
jgi:NADH dehydrogenase